MSNALPKIQALIAEALQVPLSNIASDLAMGGIPEWDSMGHMQIMMALEAKFSLDIDADTILTLTSIPAICAHLDQVSA